MNKIYGPALSLAVLLGAFSSLAAEARTNAVSDAQVFLDRLLERAKLEGKERREFRAHYAYTGSKVTEQRTSKGKIEATRDQADRTQSQAARDARFSTSQRVGGPERRCDG